MLNRAGEVLLARLATLAPAGKPIEPSVDRLLADLGYIQKVSIYRGLKQLIRAGHVRRLRRGSNGTIGVLVLTGKVRALHKDQASHLLRPTAKADAVGRLDQDSAGDLRAWGYDRVTTEEWHARLGEIPDDTRGLTARVFGDPIPGDQRRRRPDHGSRVSLAGPGRTPDVEPEGKAIA
jgi:hypothetical protein